MSGTELQTLLQRLGQQDKEYLLNELQEYQFETQSLKEFTKDAWHIVEPAQKFISGWVLDAIDEHLTAVTDGQITRLIINVPPGMMKSLKTGVFWPAWEWGARKMAANRYVCASHNQTLAIRDNVKMRRLVKSDWYQARYGKHIQLTKDQDAKTKFENTATGFRECMAAGSITGSRGDRVILDDPLSVEDADSPVVLESHFLWFTEAVPSRLNNPDRSAIIVIMQRLHELDTTGIALARDMGYEHLMLPMEFEPERKCVTSIGFEDPRTEDGELLFPKRFSKEVVERDKRAMGEYAIAGQFQQRPAPRDGGIIKRAWIRRFRPEYGSDHIVINPAFHYVIQSWDTAFKTKEKNDFSCCTTWGVNHTGAYLIHVWKKKVPFPELTEIAKRLADEYRPSKILIEDKASGQSLIQALQTGTRLPICPVKTDTDKVSRLHAVSGFFESGRVFVIEGANWEEDYIHSMCSFPGAPHDDDVDSTTQALAEIFLAGQAMRISNFSIMGR